MRSTKRSDISYQANRLQVDFATAKRIPMSVIFQVSNNDVAFCYQLGRGPRDNPKCAIVQREATAFNIIDGTTTFLSPQITPMTGWERTKPSYEEDYEADAPMTKASRFGVGYTFPCLFKAPLSIPVGDKKASQANAAKALWILISETGVTGQYCGARLSDYKAGTGYTVEYPQEGENNISVCGSSFCIRSCCQSSSWTTRRSMVFKTVSNALISKGSSVIRVFQASITSRCRNCPIVVGRYAIGFRLMTSRRSCTSCPNSGGI